MVLVDSRTGFESASALKISEPAATMVREPVPSRDATVAMDQVYVGHKPGPLALTLKVGSSDLHP